jgi:protein TonB
MPPRQRPRLPATAPPKAIEPALQPTGQPSPTSAPQPTAPASAPAPTEPSAPRISAAWQQALAAWLASHKVYPEEARRLGEQGTVTVRFTVATSGQVVDVAVVHGSGSSRLDAAAEALLRNARLPPFDPTMRQVPITATVQIHYALED